MDFTKLSFKKILVVNIFGIGDVLFTTPLLANLKRQFPDVSIGYLANRRSAAVIENNPHIDRVFVYERDEFKNLYNHSKMQFLNRVFDFFREIKQEGYDVAIDLSLNSFFPVFAFAAGIKHRVGFNYRNRGFFLTQKTELRGYEGKHVVEFYLDFLKSLNIPVEVRALELPVTAQDRQWAQEFFKTNGLKPNDTVIGVFPGGGGSWGTQAKFKRWPPESYAKLADKLIEKSKAKIILIGDKSENELCDKVLKNMRQKAVNACGETSLGQLAALLVSCRVNVLNDGGPLHIAVAAGAKTVSIFGPVDENVYGPYPQNGPHKVVTRDLPCRPCYRQFRMARCEHLSCLNGITVEEVLTAVEKVLS